MLLSRKPFRCFGGAWVYDVHFPRWSLGWMRACVRSRVYMHVCVCVRLNIWLYVCMRLLLLLSGIQWQCSQSRTVKNRWTRINQYRHENRFSPLISLLLPMWWEKPPERCRFLLTPNEQKCVIHCRYGIFFMIIFMSFSRFGWATQKRFKDK